MNNNNNFYGYGNDQPTTGQAMVYQQPPTTTVDNGQYHAFYGYGNPMVFQNVTDFQAPIYMCDPNYPNWYFDQYNNWYHMTSQPVTLFHQATQQQQNTIPVQMQTPLAPHQPIVPAPQPVTPPPVLATPVNNSGLGNNLPPFANPVANTPHPTVKVQLRDQKLWTEFYEKTNEMIVTLKGKEIFPRLCFTVSGLKSTSRYQWTIRLVQVCPYLKKWDSKEKCWKVTVTEVEDTGRLGSIELRSSIGYGSDWEKNGVNAFEKAQVYNTVSEKNKGKMSVEKKKDLEKKTENKMRVSSFCSYRPVLSVMELSENGGLVVPIPIESFHFAETEFVVVTEYKNPTIKAMKTTYNNFNRKDTQMKAAKILSAEEGQNGKRNGIDSGYVTSSRGSSVSPIGASPVNASFPSHYSGVNGSAPTTSSQF
ncbi:hypothetical protein CAEBREN_23740 [Caenorhabditis brenneri]|uniref:T-box domain-containing protein n=1 Tax=Caenorhabditis brenneri TaxID=135651 RepID=G0NZK3_CAEBE|nr:hypothetical protein CAEBREN_23740 [Caenorhabditis brenneri]